MVKNNSGLTLKK